MYNVLAQELTDISTQLEPIMTKISNVVTTGDIVNILGTAVAFGVPFFLVYMGARKLVRVATSAIQKGSIRV